MWIKLYIQNDSNVCYFEIEVSQKLFSQMHLSLMQCGK
jgi:hypothetical protein